MWPVLGGTCSYQFSVLSGPGLKAVQFSRCFQRPKGFCSLRWLIEVCNSPVPKARGRVTLICDS
jgi:hypothetical protein